MNQDVETVVYAVVFAVTVLFQSEALTHYLWRLLHWERKVDGPRAIRKKGCSVHWQHADSKDSAEGHSRKPNIKPLPSKCIATNSYIEALEELDDLLLLENIHDDFVRRGDLSDCSHIRRGNNDQTETKQPKHQDGSRLGIRSSPERLEKLFAKSNVEASPAFQLFLKREGSSRSLVSRMTDCTGISAERCSVKGRNPRDRADKRVQSGDSCSRTERRSTAGCEESKESMKHRRLSMDTQPERPQRTRSSDRIEKACELSNGEEHEESLHQSSTEHDWEGTEIVSSDDEDSCLDVSISPSCNFSNDDVDYALDEDIFDQPVQRGESVDMRPEMPMRISSHKSSLAPMCDVSRGSFEVKSMEREIATIQRRGSMDTCPAKPRRKSSRKNLEPATVHRISLCSDQHAKHPFVQRNHSQGSLCSTPGMPRCHDQSTRRRMHQRRRANQIRNIRHSKSSDSMCPDMDQNAMNNKPKRQRRVSKNVSSEDRQILERLSSSTGILDLDF